MARKKSQKPHRGSPSANPPSFSKNRRNTSHSKTQRKIPPMKNNTLKVVIEKGEDVTLVSMLKNKSANLPINFPDTSVFVPIKTNIVRDGLSESTVKAIQMGYNNKITCSCGPGVNCATNRDCKCRHTADNFKSHFKNQFQRKKGRLIEIQRRQFWRPFFACSESCGCGPECGLSILREVNKNLEEKFEVKRMNEVKGFAVFSKTAFKRGQIVMEFNGELASDDKIYNNEMAEQYSMQVMNKDTAIGGFLRNASFIDEEYRKVLKNAFMSPVYINPLSYGSLARFLSHDCDPNLQPIRVFQEGVSPADLRIVFVATKDIKAGDEIGFDYGKEYKETYLHSNCLCPTCVARRDANWVRNGSFHSHVTVEIQYNYCFAQMLARGWDLGKHATDCVKMFVFPRSYLRARL